MNKTIKYIIVVIATQRVGMEGCCVLCWFVLGSLL